MAPIEAALNPIVVMNSFSMGTQRGEVLEERRGVQRSQAPPDQVSWARLLADLHVVEPLVLPHRFEGRMLWLRWKTLPGS